MYSKSGSEGSPNLISTKLPLPHVVLYLPLVDVEGPAVALLVIVDHGAHVAGHGGALAPGEDTAQRGLGHGHHQHQHQHLHLIHRSYFFSCWYHYV